MAGAGPHVDEVVDDGEEDVVDDEAAAEDDGPGSPGVARCCGL